MIYLDHNATSPMRPEAAEACRHVLDGIHGNPSSVHGPGRSARAVLDSVRREIAGYVGLHDSQVIFTSGGTESNATALNGILSRYDSGTLLVSQIEHPSVLEMAHLHSKQGVVVETIPVDGSGVIQPEKVEEMLQQANAPRAVSVMHANNETGVLQPIAAITGVCRKMGVPLHVDAVQSLGKLDPERERDAFAADLVSISAHKIGGPKGVGALLVDKALSLEPLIAGGGQERNRRSGTENLIGVAGFGAALRQSAVTGDQERLQMQNQRDWLQSELESALPDLLVFGSDVERLPNTLALALPGILGETLVMRMDLEGFAVGSGSACSSGKQKGSHVLQAMGVAAEISSGLLRISVGWNTTRQEVEQFRDRFIRIVTEIRAMSPIF
ncbi:MAG: cysteine desulfurase [Magnetococcales bacterium]|nr:cysteine desulfurase [Magnetococcales bacterium]